MKLYRGQEYGRPVGRWWTSDLEDARGYARSRGRNRCWIVLSIDVDARRLRAYLFDRTPTRQTYNITLHRLARITSAVRIVDGFLEVARNDNAANSEELTAKPMRVHPVAGSHTRNIEKTQ